MIKDELITKRKSLEHSYKLIINNYNLLLNLNQAIDFGHIGVCESGKLYNLVFYKYIKYDISKLSYFNLKLKCFVKKIILVEEKKNELMSQYTKNMIIINNNIDILLIKINDAISKSLIIIRYPCILVNNINIIIIKKLYNAIELDIRIPKYHHSTKMRPIVYDKFFTSTFIIEQELYNIINDKIEHISIINRELFINKFKQYYYLMCATIIFNNQYQNITDLISQFIGNDIININNDDKILNFYYNNKIKIKDEYKIRKWHVNDDNDDNDDYDDSDDIEFVKIYNNFIIKYGIYITLF